MRSGVNIELALLTARLALALIFGVAGIAKLNDTAGTRRALTDFGLPEWFAGPLARVLPIVEITVAVALLPLASAWWGAVAAATLLLIFTAVMVINLARGHAPDCHCFGQLHSQPVSWAMCARNLALTALAGAVVISGNTGLSAAELLADMKAGEVFTLALAAAGVALLAATLLYLRKTINQQAALLTQVEAIKKAIAEGYHKPAPVERDEEDYDQPAPVERKDISAPAEGLPVSAMAPDFTLPVVGGGQVSLAGLLAEGQPVLLLFVSPSCAPCKSLLPQIKVWERDYSAQLTIALLSKGSTEEVQSKLTKYGARHLLLQGESDVAKDYQAVWTPAAVLVSREGKIASPVTYGDGEIRALVNHTVTTGASIAVNSIANGYIPQVTIGNSLFRVGEPAPRFALLNRQGKQIGLEALLGTPTLLVFWDAYCPHCQEMVEDLKRWEASPPHGAPKLVLVVSSPLEEMDNEFRSLILHDPGFEVAPLFGARGTPSAILIASDGRIGSSLATGVRNILALAGVRKVERAAVTSLQ